MAKGRISKRSIDAIKPQASDTYLWDSDLPGFGVKVTPAGRRGYLIQYRLGGKRGRTRRITIGRHGIVTPEKARTEAKRLLGEVSAGRDPAQEHDRTRADLSLGELLERFLTEHAEGKLKRSTAVEYRRTARLHVLPALRHRLVGDLKRADISRLHHSLRDRPYQANRTLALLSKFFNWCEKHGLRPDGSNPCRHIDKYPEYKRERFLTGEELSRLGEALHAAETDGSATPWMIAAIRLLALTGARLNEILTLRWEHVDMEKGEARLPDSKTGAKTIYLNPPCLAILASVPQLDGNPFVICGEKPGAHLVNLEKPWRRIRKAAGLDDVRLHDMRHTFASIGVAGGMSLPMIGALLGHSQPQTTARYAHLAADPLKLASNSIGSSIAAALNPQSAKSKILKLRQ